jgi:hypothetical protein
MSIMIAIRHARLVTHTLHCLSQCCMASLANPLGVDADFVLRLLAQSQQACRTSFCLGYVVVIAALVSDDDLVAHC